MMALFAFQRSDSVFGPISMAVKEVKLVHVLVLQIDPAWQGGRTLRKQATYDYITYSQTVGTDTCTCSYM